MGGFGGKDSQYAWPATLSKLLVWGSAWDEDLDLTVEGTVQALLQEELPVTTRRLWLVNLSLLLLAAKLVLVWRLPDIVALLVLFLLDGMVLAVAWRFSSTYLPYLLKKG